jgi:hypothetical protein
MSGAEIRQ